MPRGSADFNNRGFVSAEEEFVAEMPPLRRFVMEGDVVGPPLPAVTGVSTRLVWRCESFAGLITALRAGRPERTGDSSGIKT